MRRRVAVQDQNFSALYKPSLERVRTQHSLAASDTKISAVHPRIEPGGSGEFYVNDQGVIMPLSLLLTILAVIGAMPIFLLVAAMTRSSLRDSQTKTMLFLEQWGGIAPSSVKEWVRATIGSTVGFALLVALTGTFNSLGDGPLIPYISGKFSHFGAEYTHWSDGHETEWKTFRDGVRINWVKAHPDDDLNKDAASFDKWKQDRGKNRVRIPRTLIFFSLILAVAGLVDLTGKNFRKRGALLLIVGLTFTISFLYIWADRKNSYVHNVFIANESLGQYKLPPPMSLTNQNVR